MRKWSPEPFDTVVNPVSADKSRAPLFEAGMSNEASVSLMDNEPEDGFRKDPALSRNTSLWNLMSETEKDEIRARVRQDLQTEYIEIQGDHENKHRAELDSVRAEFATSLNNWRRELATELAAEKSRTATQAAGLALALAGKIIRDTVEIDPQFVVRTLETALFKIQDSHELTAVLNPEDADMLSGDPELMKNLRITEIVPDRRVEKGGCRLRSGIHEWDATLSRQMDTLTAIVEESLAAGQTRSPDDEGDDHDRLLG